MRPYNLEVYIEGRISRHCPFTDIKALVADTLQIMMWITSRIYNNCYIFLITFSSFHIRVTFSYGLQSALTRCPHATREIMRMLGSMRIDA